ncbi:MAG: hypothetical protein IJB60_08100 [Bacteroidaceae bacterium]|nr:hypothetical protein [Bacteroidaceae bacterium]
MFFVCANDIVVVAVGNRIPRGTITAPLPEGAVRSHSTACDDGTFMFPKEFRRALSRSD